MKFKFSTKDLLLDVFITLYGKGNYTIEDFKTEIANEMKDNEIEGDVKTLANEYVEKLFVVLEKRFTKEEKSMEKDEKTEYVKELLKQIEVVKPDKDCTTCWGGGKMLLTGKKEKEDCNCVLKRRRNLRRKLMQATGYAYVKKVGEISLAEYEQRVRKDLETAKETITEKGISA
jgi:hypothetical protein